MARKVRFGLRNTKYAIYNPTTGEYGSVKEMPWAVALSLSAEGGDGADFYADDTICYKFAGTNGGDSGTFELANIPDSIRADLLGEVVDAATGVQFEIGNAEPAQFALITEMQTDNGPMGFVFYNCKASRPDIAANTKSENPSVDTETLSLSIATQEFTYDGSKKLFIQGHIQKTDQNAELYNAFFASVVTPGGAESGLSA